MYQNPFADLIPQRKKPDDPYTIQGPPREPPPQTADQAALDRYQAQAGAMDPQVKAATLEGIRLENDRKRRELAKSDPSEPTLLGDTTKTGADYLKTLPTADAAIIRAMAEGRAGMPAGFAMRSPHAMQLLSEAAQFDPSFDAANLPARIATRKLYTSGAQSKNIVSLNTALGHLDELAKSAEDLGNFDGVPFIGNTLNAAKNAYHGHSGGPSAAPLARFGVAQKAVTNEMERVFSGSGGTLSALKDWEATVSASKSPSELRAAISEGAKLLQSRLEALQQGYNGGMGTTDQELPFLHPHARDTIQALQSNEYQTNGYKGALSFIGRGKGGQPPQAGGTQPPLDPTGSGDIGFNQSAQGLPPQAQAAQRDLQAKILGGAFHSPEDFINYAKKTYGFDIKPDQAKAGIEAVRKGGAVQVNTPQFAPQLSDARGTPQADQNLALQQRILSGLPGGGVLMGAGQIFGPQKVDAFTRGVGDVPTMGMSEELLSGFDPARLAQQNAIRDYDKEHNAGARFSGQLLGGFALPTGVPGAARGAGVDAIRAGGSRAEALLAATKAGSLRAGREGALYSGAYGVGSTDGGPLERLSGGAVDASIGAGTGYLGGRVFGGLFGRNGNRRATSAGAANLPPLVDPATGSLNQPLENASPAQRMAAGQKFGMDLSLDAAGGRTAALLGKGMDIMPGSAGVMDSKRRVLQGQTESAVSQLADRYGSARTLNEAGGALQTRAQNWIDRLDNRVVPKAYDAIPIKGSDPAALGNTRDALNRLTTIFQSNPKLAAAFQNNKLNTYLDALTEKVRNVDTGILGPNGSPIARQVKEGGGLSWQDLKDMRSRIGYEIGEQRFSDSPTKDELRSLYGAMSEDMRATAAAKGPGALRAFERANNLYAQGQQRIEGALVRILGDDSMKHPEAAAAAIQTIAKGGRASGDIRQLGQIRASLMKGGEWNDVASTLIRLGGQPANSQGRDFNPQTFINWYADMSEPARNLLFGDGGRAELRRALDGFVGVTQRLQGTNSLRNSSQTATGVNAASLMSTFASAPWSPGTAAAAGGTMASLNGAARIWTSPKFVNWATGYTKMMAGGRATPATQDAWARRLGGIAKSEPAIANDVLSIQQRITDALGSTYSRAAASSQEEERRKRQQPY